MFSCSEFQAGTDPTEVSSSEPVRRGFACVDPPGRGRVSIPIRPLTNLIFTINRDTVEADNSKLHHEGEIP